MAVPTSRTAILSPKTLVEVWQNLLRQADDRYARTRHHRTIRFRSRIHLLNLPSVRNIEAHVAGQCVDALRILQLRFFQSQCPIGLDQPIAILPLPLQCCSRIRWRGSAATHKRCTSTKMTLIAIVNIRISRLRRGSSSFTRRVLSIALWKVNFRRAWNETARSRRIGASVEIAVFARDSAHPEDLKWQWPRLTLRYPHHHRCIHRTIKFVFQRKYGNQSDLLFQPDLRLCIVFCLLNHSPEARQSLFPQT